MGRERDGRIEGRTAVRTVGVAKLRAIDPDNIYVAAESSHRCFARGIG
jgi:hypothetical protein